MKNEHYNSISQDTRTPSNRLPGILRVPAMIRKPLSVVLAESNEEALVRHLTLFDLVVLGVAGTLGTGIFAIVGLIGHNYAGPAGVVSWVLAGIGCIFSGLSYAELSSVIPSQGGAYAYAFVALGELPAAVTAWCLTLEFGVSSASVARVWADKVLEWVLMGSDSGMRRFLATILDPFPRLGISPVAAGLQALCVIVLLRGVTVGKRITTVLTALKLAVCAFIIIAGLALFQGDNLVPFAPMGVSGIARGSAAAFYGYLGYDEVCALAGEAINPRKNVPLSIAYILAIVGVSYFLSALALAGMVAAGAPAGASFVLAFSSRGWGWASKIVAVGELVSLPVVVLAALMVQPRLLSVLANDGLLPKSLSATDEQGVLRTATLISGVATVITAGVAPFAALADFISAGVLMCFAITNSCAIIVRRSNLDPAQPGPCRSLVLLFNGLCLLAAMMLKLAMASAGTARGAVTAATVISSASAATAGLSFLAAGVVMLAVSKWCPETSHPLGGPQAKQAFRGPFSPWVPALGVVVNWFLFAQLSWGSVLWTFWATAGVCVWYFVYGLKHSVGQQSTTWPQLAAATALAASDTSTACDPPSPTAFNVFCDPGEPGRSGWSSNLRTTLPGGESPLESSPTRRGSRGAEGGGWGVEGVGLRPGWQRNGYTSDAPLI